MLKLVTKRTHDARGAGRNVPQSPSSLVEIGGYSGRNTVLLPYVSVHFSKLPLTEFSLAIHNSTLSADSNIANQIHGFTIDHE